MTIKLMAVKPRATVTIPPVCMSLWERSVSSTLSLAVSPFARSSWPVTAAGAPSLTAVPATARPKSRVEVTGVGYAAPAAEARRAVDGIGRDVPSGTAAGTSFIGSNGNGKQQDQLHLMSRRDPRTWRPPA